MTQLCPLCRTRYDEPLGKCKKDGTILIEDRTGQSLAGRYTFRELLGIGSNGATVWEAWQEDADRRVAVRLLYLRENERDYFLEASGQTAALDHPRIGRIYDYNKAEDGLACNVMELIDGRPLAGELGDGRQMAVADALPLILQVLDALDYAHRRNILHLDLKPGNIFLVHGADGEPPKVKVVDFALAPPQSVIDRYGGPTPGDDRVPEALRYTAPELLANGRASPQSDIYSVGCLLFQMIAGAPPFPQTSGTLVARGHLTHPPPSPFRIQALGEMPPALPEILERALEKAPTRRFESAAAMRSALEAARRGESIADVSDEEATIARVKVDDLVTSAPIVGPKSGGPSVVIDLPEAAPSRGANKPILVAAILLGVAIALLIYKQIERPVEPQLPPVTPPAPSAVAPVVDAAVAPPVVDAAPAPAPTPADAAAAAKPADAAAEPTGPITSPVAITTDPSGAEILLGETSLGHTPWREVLLPGRYVVELRAPGHTHKMITIDVGDAGEPISVHEKLAVPAAPRRAPRRVQRRRPPPAAAPATVDAEPEAEPADAEPEPPPVDAAVAAPPPPPAPDAARPEPARGIQVLGREGLPTDQPAATPNKVPVIQE